MRFHGGGSIYMYKFRMYAQSVLASRGTAWNLVGVGVYIYVCDDVLPVFPTTRESFLRYISVTL